MQLMNEPRRTRWERRRYRSGAVFVRDPSAHSTPMDRNARARLLQLAEGLERRTKAAGRRNGALGQIGLQVLRALILRFHNSQSGLCCPSIFKLQLVTGLSRGAVCDALARLERSGIVRIVRRIIKAAVTRMCAITGQMQNFVGTVQSSNLYRFAIEERAIEWHEIDRLLPSANPRPFPSRRQKSLFEMMFRSAAESAQQTDN